MEYYASSKWNEILFHATKWNKLKVIMLSKISWSQKKNPKYCMTLLIKYLKLIEIMKRKCKQVKKIIVNSWGREKEEFVF